MKNIGILVSLSLFVLGCAKANYADPQVEQTISVQQSPKMSCDLRFSKSGYCLSWFWEERPSSQKPGAFVFKVYRLNTFDQTAVPIEPQAHPEVILWMPGHGHGSSPTRVERIEVGTFRTRDVFFIMPGAWEIRFQIKNGEELVDSLSVGISI